MSKEMNTSVTPPQMQTASRIDLLAFMQERQRIFLKRQAGAPRPWTLDALLADYHFTNIYREQDRTTAWIRANWREPYAKHSNLWFAMAVARWINFPDTLCDLGFPDVWEPGRVLEALKSRQARKLTVFSSAYRRGMTEGKGGALTDAVKKLDNLYAKADPKRLTDTTLQRATEYLMTFEGYGGDGFMAGEVVSDLRWTRYLSRAPDVLTWTNPGPGVLRGLNRIYQRSVDTKSQYHRDRAIGEMRDLRSWLMGERDPKILPTLELRDIAMALCEYDKYKRAQDALRNGERIGLRSFHPPPRRLF